MAGRNADEPAEWGSEDACVQSRVPQSAADLHQLLLSGHVVRSAYGNPRVFVPVAVVHERVHLHRFHGIRYGESAGFRIQSVRHAYVGADDGNKAPVLRTVHAGAFQEHGAKKPYLIYAMCDETFAVNNSAQIPADVDRGWFYFFVSLLNQVSWVAGATLGGIVGGRLTFDTTGLDFVMTALFVVIFVDQWLTTKRKSHMAALTGIVVPVICMALFGADNFMIPSLIAMLVMFIMLRPYLDDLKPDDVGKRDDADGAVESAADRNEVGEARS